MRNTRANILKVVKAQYEANKRLSKSVLLKEETRKACRKEADVLLEVIQLFEDADFFADIASIYFSKETEEN